MTPRTSLVWLTLDRGTRLLASLVSGALIVRALTPTDFGLLTQALLALALLDTISSLGIPAVFGSRVAVAAERERPYLLRSALTLRTIMAVGCATVAYAVAQSAAPVSVSTAMTTALLLALALNNWAISDSYLQGVGHPTRGAIVKTIVALTFVIVRWLHVESGIPSPASFAVIYCVEQTIMSVAMLLMCRRPQRLASAPKLRPDAVGTPFIRHAMIMWTSQLVTLVYMRVDQAIISFFGSQPELAKYAVAVQLAEQAYTLPIILNAVFVSRIGEMSREVDSTLFKDMMLKLYRWGFLGACVIAAIAIAVAPIFIPRIYGDSYNDSASLFMILMLAVPFVTIGSLQNLSIFTGNNPSIHIKRTVAAALLSVPLAALGWALFGLHGLAISVVLLQFFVCFLGNLVFDPDAFRLQLSAIVLRRRTTNSHSNDND
jgi:O-antigen/teichoic acid export membrane protein